MRSGFVLRYNNEIIVMALINKTVVITGAASGVGLSTAKVFLQEGVEKLLLLDINKEQGQINLNSLKSEYPNATIIFREADVSQEDVIKDLFQYAKRTFDYVDIIVNCAAKYNSYTQWRQMVEVNLIGVINCTMIGLEYMSTENEGRGGTIVNLSSLGGLGPVYLNPVYSATKHAVVGLTRSYAMPLILEKTGVKFITICPTLIDTPMCQDVYKNRTPYIEEEVAKRMIEFVQPISVKYVSRAVIDAVLDGENGSVWLVFGENTQKTEFPNYISDQYLQ